jgi:hypothetical protein
MPLRARNASCSNTAEASHLTPTWAGPLMHSSTLGGALVYPTVLPGPPTRLRVRARHQPPQLLRREAGREYLLKGWLKLVSKVQSIVRMDLAGLRRSQRVFRGVVLCACAWEPPRAGAVDGVWRMSGVRTHTHVGM